jgi:hypothetical protein
VQTVTRGTARCALHAHGRGARDNSAAIALRCFRRRFQQSACACGC